MRVYDACAALELSAPDASAAELAAIDAALAAWAAVGVTAPTRAAADATVDVRFEPSNPALYGYYDPDTATILVITQLTDPSERAITIAHEVGHALGLVHIPTTVRSSVMNPGNLQVAPTSDDRDALVARWGACAATL